MSFHIWQENQSRLCCAFGCCETDTDVMPESFVIGICWLYGSRKFPLLLLLVLVNGIHVNAMHRIFNCLHKPGIWGKSADLLLQQVGT